MKPKILSVVICVLMVTSIFGIIPQEVGEQGPYIYGTDDLTNSIPQQVGSPILNVMDDPTGIPLQNGPIPSESSSGTGGLANSPWPMFGHDIKHTGLSRYDTSTNPGKEKWNFTTGYWIGSSPAIDSNGTIYIGSYDHNLYAIYPDGTEIWNFTTNAPIRSSPSIGSDGTIYIGSDDYNLYAINIDGSKKWNFTTGGLVNSPPTIGSDGTIYFGSYDYRVYAINPDGTEKWSFITGNYVGASSPAIGSDETIYIGSGDQNLYAIYPNGTEKWRFKTDGFVSSPTIGSDDTIYIGSSDYKLYAINPNGTEKWSFITGGGVGLSPSIDSYGIIYVGSGDNNLYAINPNGTKKWSFATGDNLGSSPAIGLDGTIFVGSHDGKLYAINPDGSERWKFDIGSRIWTSPAIGSDGTIYIGCQGKRSLYAIGSLNIPPIADAGLDQILNEGDTIQFDASSSYDPDGTIVNYEWDFDSNDGLWWETGVDPDATGPTPIHTYGDDGVYIATLRVTDDTSLNGTDICNITVNNVAPTINPFGPFIIDEGSYIMFDSNVTDPGSDDLTFKYDWGDGTSPTTIVYYNDGIGPEPIYDPGTNEIKSPDGNYSFGASDTQQHTYGDNGVYLLTLTVEDDDGGASFYNTTVVVNNIAPIVTLVMTPFAKEGSQLTFEANASDPGSDDLTFSWQFEYGPTIKNTHYNDGVGPEPVYDPGTNEIKSPWGAYPFNVSDSVNHTYGDDYNYTLVLTVTDDDGGTVTYTSTISIDNVAPSIVKVWIPYVAYEGASAAYGAVARDNGSDDLTFEWDFGDSTPIVENIYYNDGANPDPYPSPDGTYPFTASDTLNHTYGDDYNYTSTLKVTDDDDGITTFSTTVYVNNVAPTIEPFGPFTVDEGSPINLTAISTDPGSDDLQFEWNLEFGPTITNTFYNDGVGPDPYPSPWGTYAFNATNTVTHTYGDNYVYNVTLTVTDDDGDSANYTTNITVNNVPPTVVNIKAYMHVNFTLRVAGEKWHSVNMTLYEDDIEIWDAKVTRQPGSPDEQAATLSNYKINIGSCYRAVVDYLPNDPRVNGNVWGANPVWVILTFEGGSETRIHHTFNVRKSYWDSDHWNHIDPWEVDLTGVIYRHNISYEATATDPGSDDLNFYWDFGDGGAVGPNTYFNNGVNPDMYPSPEINLMDVTDTVMYAHNASGIYTVTLTVVDDDGGTITTTLIIVVPG